MHKRTPRCANGEFGDGETVDRAGRVTLNELRLAAASDA